jgi:molecular chaperone DnaJ
MLDYYEILGIDHKADEAEIKKAYRRLAMQYHPDRNPGDKSAAETFKKVQEAHVILGDPEKKKEFDKAFFAPIPNFNPANKIQDIFDTFFNQRPRSKGWGQHVEMELVIDFLESAKGCTKILNIDKREVCVACNGTCARDGTEFKECVLCDGKGKTFYHHSSQSMYSRMETTCVSCRGSGKVISSFCTECSARGYNVHPCSLEVKIPAGISDGMKICIRGEGDIGVSGVGNLYCVVRVKPHPLFQREGINLFLKLPITYSQAALGGELEVPSLNGTCKFKLPAGTKSGSTFRMPGLGFCLPDDDDDGKSKGDLLVKVIVETLDVTKMPEKYQDLIKQLLEIEKDNPGEMQKTFQKNLELTKGMQ